MCIKISIGQKRLQEGNLQLKAKSVFIIKLLSGKPLKKPITSLQDSQMVIEPKQGGNVRIVDQTVTIRQNGLNRRDEKAGIFKAGFNSGTVHYSSHEIKCNIRYHEFTG